MTQYLAVTAMGTDRPGIVNELAKLTTECDCNIIDSRMATFGNEFTLIMLVGGDYRAIALLESALPERSAQLELMTVCKRTSEHESQSFTSRLVVEFEGLDRRGTLNRITQFLADHELDLSGFRTHSEASQDGPEHQQIEFRVNVTRQVVLDELESALKALADELELDCKIHRMEGNSQA